jgi:hypothetical protein
VGGSCIQFRIALLFTLNNSVRKAITLLVAIILPVVGLLWGFFFVSVTEMDGIVLPVVGLS